MWEYLDKLKQKPKVVRQRIALVSTVFLSSLIFFMWWTTFTASEFESTIGVSEALSPLAALTEMATQGADAAGEFTESLKSHILQVQNEASSLDPSFHLGGAASNDTFSTGGDDVVYPEDVYDVQRVPGETKEEHTISNE